MNYMVPPWEFYRAMTDTSHGMLLDEDSGLIQAGTIPVSDEVYFEQTNRNRRRADAWLTLSVAAEVGIISADALGMLGGLAAYEATYISIANLALTAVIDAVLHLRR